MVERLILFAARIIRLAAALPKTKVGQHISGQIVRSGTSGAPTYAEAQDAESNADFVHKLKVVLKELRETNVWLRIIVKAEQLKPSQVRPLIKESDELISIFVASVKTARSRRDKPPGPS